MDAHATPMASLSVNDAVSFQASLLAPPFLKDVISLQHDRFPLYCCYIYVQMCFVNRQTFDHFTWPHPHNISHPIMTSVLLRATS